MKFLKLLSPFLIFLFLLSCYKKNEKEEEKTPIHESKEAVQPFAKHIFSQFTNIRDFTINDTETEAYFSLQSPGRELSIIMKIEKKKDEWQQPQISSFSGKYIDLEPFLSPDNLRLYFASNRPISKDSAKVKDFDIWYVERRSLNSKWSEPTNIGLPINTEADEFYPAVTNSGNIYFTAITEESGPADDIFMSKWTNNNYEKPIILSDSINTKGAEFNAFVSPDESYIIFSGWRRQDGIGAGDMYISYNNNGAWSKAKNLGKDINSKQTDFCPFVQNETLYFTSRRSNVSNPKDGFATTENLLKEINRYDNGASRIYQVNLKAFIKE